MAPLLVTVRFAPKVSVRRIAKRTAITATVPASAQTTRRGVSQESLRPSRSSSTETII
jgi:hypothetical protein